MQTCRHCQVKFDISQEDLDFYEKVSPIINGQKQLITPPTLCPDCRLQKRLNWRTELRLFLRPSSKTGQQILSQYNPSSPMTVYSTEEWWADDWNAMDYGQDFDFSQPFFPQFKKFREKIPVINLSVKGNTNCDYVNSAAWSKDSYLIAGASYAEDSYYCRYIVSCKNCVDCNVITNCELCYDCINSHNCYNLKYSVNCKTCSDSFFLQDCANCKNCFGCVNQNNKEYMYFNQQLTKEQYEASIAQFELDKRSSIQHLKKMFSNFSLKYPRRSILGTMNENVSGDSINNSQNSFHCFDADKLEDCKYCVQFLDAKNCMDCFSWGMTAENCYENMEVGDGSQNVAFSFSIWASSNTYYSYNCHKCEDIFGCVSLRNKQYCIFNKQYTKEEYFELVSKIIEHMKSTKEWGEYFPFEDCPFSYNESIAQDLNPITAEKAKELKANWTPEKTYTRPENAPDIPDSIKDTDQNICTTTLYSTQSNKPFKIIPQELKFYKDNNIPLPTTTFYERLLDRLSKRNPKHLYSRHCDKCQASIQTTFAPDRPEIVYCEQCYLETTY